MEHVNRRQFLAASGAVIASGYRSHMMAQTTAPATQPDNQTSLPAITFGRTGRVLPRLGLGTAPISGLQSDDEAVQVIRHAIAKGVRYIDTAPSYGNGAAERRIGLALAACGLARSDFFLATKTMRRDADGARRELEESLNRLRVDYVDSVQCHEVHDDVQELFKANSVLTGLERARDEGLIKHIGVTGHRHPRWLIEAVNRHPFVTALVPINPLDTQHLSFISEFLPIAAQTGTAVIAMKIYAGGHLIEDGPLTAAQCLHYALSQQAVAIAAPGCLSVQHVDEAFDAVLNFKPLSADQQRELEQRAGQHQGKQSEWYKDE